MRKEYWPIVAFTGGKFLNGKAVSIVLFIAAALAVIGKFSEVGPDWRWNVFAGILLAGVIGYLTKKK